MCAGALAACKLRDPSAHLPHSRQLRSLHNWRLLTVGSRGEPGSRFTPPPPVAPGSFIRASGLEQRRGGARHSHGGPFAHLAKAGENEDGGPQVCTRSSLKTLGSVITSTTRSARPRDCRQVG
ncbi:uncharacterized protein LOC120885619 [Ictidomys tridecemlineatus]